MSVILNPGSGPVAASGNGWTNSYETALAKARQWLANIEGEGIRDVELLVPSDPDQWLDGRWRFGFRHKVTEVTVWLQTHGIDNLDAYERERLFAPKVYWNESSISEPAITDWPSRTGWPMAITDWLADGFEVVQTFRRSASEGAEETP